MAVFCFQCFLLWVLSCPDDFQDLMTNVCQVLRSQGVPCTVELDDVLIYSEGKQNSLRATHLAISILECASFKITVNLLLVPRKLLIT